LASFPPALQPGATIGITCPSGYVSHERVAHAVDVLQRWGFRVTLGSTVGSEHYYFSGTDELRLADLQAMLDDDGIDAILAGRGGYGMSRIIDRLDFSRFAEKPKWVCGFSDITVLHSHLHAATGIPTIHGPMCGAFTPETDGKPHLESLRRALSGAAMRYSAPPHAANRLGEAEGILVGGNLAILAHLSGSRSQVDTRGKLLFIEDVGEYLYNVDRMLLNLKRAGTLNELAGLVVGSFTEGQDTERPFGQEVEQIIRDKVAEYDYPVCFGFPAGHGEVNYALRLGMPHRLAITEGYSVLSTEGLSTV
jgi:muramoyltetrapeptide carboxypeptidase